MNLLRMLMIATPLMAPIAHAATTEELEARVGALAEQLRQVQAELAQLRQAQGTQAGSLPSTVASSSVGSPALTPAANGNVAGQGAPVAPAGESSAPLSFWGYGELNYYHPTRDSAQTTADVARLVLGASYRFDENTRFFSELEVEHGVSSAEDPGEVEVEQAFIERRFTDALFLRAGLVLIPSGFLNEFHEPTRYYGVARNFVETGIIPTTWREGGIQLLGSTEAGLSWSVGVTTGFNLNKWDAASGEGQESPLGAIHQELAQASARDLSGFLSLSYSGVPGLRLGASAFTGGATQGQSALGSARVSLWEAHARWSPAQWEFSALYARGHISNTAVFNLRTLGSPSPIPEEFFGWYGEAAWHAIDRGNWSITPFIRYERFNPASAYADLGQGLTPDALRDREVFTGGINWMIAPGVVVKADYLGFRHGSGDNRYDLGLGYQF